MHEALFAAVLMLGSEAILWKEEERSRVRVVKMHNLRGLLGIRKMDTAMWGKSKMVGLLGESM